MARQVFKISTDLLNNPIPLGITINFSTPQVFTKVYTTKDQVKNNLINYILTNNGERLFNYNFGSNITNQLFESITSENLESTLQNLSTSIVNNVPNITNLVVTYDTDIDNNAIYVKLSYQVFNQSDTLTLQL